LEAAGSKAAPYQAWLLVLSLAVVIPVAWLTAGQVRATDRALATTRLERRGIEGIGFAGDLLATIERIRIDQADRVMHTHAAVPLTDDERMDIGSHLVTLEREDPGNTFGAAAQLRSLRSTWNRTEHAQDGSQALLALGDPVLQVVSAIDDGTKLAYESNVVIGNLDEAYAEDSLGLAELLSAATYRLRIAAAQGDIGLDDRITTAGGIARGQTASTALGTVLALSMKNDHDVRDALEPALNREREAEDYLATPLDALLRGQTLGQQDDLALVVRARDFLLAGASFEDVLRDQLDTLMLQRLQDQAGMRVGSIVWAGLAILASIDLVWLIGLVIVRRSRAELDRAQERAAKLEAELARQDAERALVQSEAQFRAIFEGSQIGMATMDSEALVVESNQALDVLLANIGDRLIAADDHRFAEVISGYRRAYQMERRLRRNDGASLWVEVTVSTIGLASPGRAAAIALVQDISERKLMNQRLEHEATHDPLTSLPNRSRFLHDLNAAIAKRRQTPTSAFAVLFIDLDNFKMVNDSLGHFAGDRVLMEVAARISTACRGDDVVARLHGDEFAVLLGGIDRIELVRAIADGIRDEVRIPVDIGGEPVFVTSSVGIVIGHDEYESAEDLLRDADTAMYQAKLMGRGGAVLFDEGMQHEAAQRMRITTDIRLGIQRGEFKLAFQPIVSLQTRLATGAEALLRWNHPLYGEITPTRFIPIAEESDAIIELGRLALREACVQLAHCDWELPDVRPLRMGVNLSVRQIADEGFVADVKRFLSLANISGERLVLELTESALLENGERAANIFAALKELGVQLCIDDFGTGYSSLRYLDQLPLDMLKIDRSFVHRYDGEIASEPIVQMILTLAQSMGLSVVAEGVETEYQAAKLLEMGCKFGQGFLLARPMPGDAFLAWLKSQSTRRSTARSRSLP
jgi:diguanylate cyclase (GGDEF)-like protein